MECGINFGNSDLFGFGFFLFDVESELCPADQYFAFELKQKMLERFRVRFAIQKFALFSSLSHFVRKLVAESKKKKRNESQIIP